MKAVPGILPTLLEMICFFSTPTIDVEPKNTAPGPCSGRERRWVLCPYLFLNPGSFSFFRKAAMASFWSSVAKHRPKASLS